jgi:dolichol-phosphate mannosyltransferase
MKTAVVIPTYNERENLGQLVEAIVQLPIDLNVIVVDDNSPDGTGQVADALTIKYPEKVEVIHRQGKGGRGSACIAGFRSALQRSEFGYLLEMDADFSHDPKDIVRFVEELEKRPDCDIVIGARYVSGGKIVGWGIQRHILSRISNFFARVMLGVPIHDYTNGYRCYTRRALEAIDFDRIEARGYIVLSEMAYQLHRAGLKFAELPILFINRRRGASNTTLREIADSFTSVIKLRLKYGRA